MLLLIVSINCLFQWGRRDSHATEFWDDAYSKAVNARCLDGSSAGILPGEASRKENSTKFIVYFQGDAGGAVWQNECVTRPARQLVRLAHIQRPFQSKGGIVDPDRRRTQIFFSWNHVWVPYCDGNIVVRKQVKPVKVGNTTIYYRGRANMRALVEALRRDAGMELATDIIMDGGSAGGLTVLLHADFFGSLLPPTSKFAAIGDAGWFRPSIALDKVGYTESIGLWCQIAMQHQILLAFDHKRISPIVFLHQTYSRTYQPRCLSLKAHTTVGSYTTF